MASQPSRRALLKKSALGAAAAGVVWSAPKIEGLSLRPDYAAAQTMSGASFDLTVLFPSGSPPAGTNSTSPAPSLNFASVYALADAHGGGTIVGPAAANTCAITGFDVLYGDTPGLFNVDYSSQVPGLQSHKSGDASSGVPTNLTMHVTCT